MIRNTRLMFKVPFVGLTIFLMFFGIVNGLQFCSSLQFNEVSSIHTCQIDNPAEVNVVANQKAADKFGKKSQQLPVSEEENENKTEKDDLQALCFATNTKWSYLFLTEITAFGTQADALRAQTQPLYVLYHSWKSHLA